MGVRKSLMASVAIAAGTSLLVVGCGSSKPATANSNNSANASNSTSTATPTKGGTLNYALPSQTQLNWYLPIMTPAADSVYNAQLIDQMYKPLIWIDQNYKIDYGSSIASKITYNKQGTVYHVFLNSKWKWSDGTPVTAKDVLFTWKLIKGASAKNAPKPWPYVGAGTGYIPDGIKSVVATNQHEVTITLKKPANQQWFIYNGIIQLTPMPAKTMDKYPSNLNKELSYIGTNANNAKFIEQQPVDGPFKLQSATRSQSWVLVPNTSYAGHKTLLNKLIFTYEASSQAEFAALKAGNIDVGYLPISMLGSKSALTSMGDKVTPGYPFGIFWTEMNMWPGSPTKSIFDNLYVRQALQMSIPNKEIASKVYKGFAKPIFGPIPGTPKTKFLDPNLQNPYPYNPTKAKKLLEQHGWKEVNGVMTKGSQKLQTEMLYVSGQTTTKDVAVLMQQEWAKIGVKVTLKAMPFSNFIGVTSNKKDHSWGLAFGSGWIYNGPGFYPTGGQLFASTAPSGTGFSDKKEDSLITATHQPYATSQETMKHFFAYEDYTAKVLPFLWDNNVASLTVTSPKVQGVLSHLNPATDFPRMQYWSKSK
ncbi:peptide ABC transporter substrate-binding protein [Alicyclobacillus sp. SO9]|uniref:peptide ABC transporter substrate-binding protein n=1 Tax=Alicyclobacillus sp. SO9 TaxID=2665646 RepID=UPI0018E8B888|nr:peptide ABC transporter substrate-binding protein [Alicyclobacillus sp. SO9]QQE79146.1 peptide ABC transporter substrate-binding protein [Alicyclobacillus sp. SO9]